MNKEPIEKQVLQWHPAFFASIQIEFEDEESKLIFENEHQLGTKPKEIDVLIIKKNSKEPIHKNIGRIFRTHNIVEYKSPTDYLSVDDFYKVYAYACFYKADSPTEGSIPAEEITITFVCKKFPYKMVQHLKEMRKFNIVNVGPGIYSIEGDVFGMQLLVTSRLPEENNLWLRNLTNDLTDKNAAQKLIHSYEKHKQNNNYKSAMNIIVRANTKLFQEEDKSMCEALEELMKDKFEQQREMGIQEGMQQGMQQTIPALIKAYKMLNLSTAEILNTLVTELDITENMAQEFVAKYV